MKSNFLKKADIEPADNVYNGIINKISMRCRGGRTVQAAACRAAIYGFNSHPRLPNMHPHIFSIVPNVTIFGSLDNSFETVVEDKIRFMRM